MKKFLEKLRFRYLALAILFVAVAAFGFNHMRDNVVADSCGNGPVSPAFNIWPLAYDSSNCRDLPLVDVKNLDGTGRDANYAANASEHAAGINAKPGDKVRVSVYFHNGATPDFPSATTALNTLVQTQVDAGSSTSHNVSAAVTADNANAAYSIDASRGGDTKINTAVPTTLSYVSGSTQLCIKDAAAVEYGLTSTGSCGSGQVLVNLPDGVFNGAVNIGNVKACFEYSGLVIFTVLVNGQAITPPPVTDTTLAIEKTVRESSVGGAFSESVTVTPGSSVDFSVVVRNTGTVTAKNVVVTDPTPAGYNFTFNPRSIGDLAPGQSSAPIIFTAIYNGPNQSVNTALAKADNTPQVSDTASVSPRAITPPPAVRSLSITKVVRDVTTSYGPSVNVSNGSTVQFQIRVTNTGNTVLNNVRLTDALPGGLNLTPNSFAISNNNGSTFNNIVVPTLAVGESFTVDFSTGVNLSNPSCGQIVNTASVIADQTASQNASATVNVICAQQTGTLQIVKQAKNLTQNPNASFTKTISANAGDRIAYQIQVTSINGPATNVTIFDNIPNFLNYTSGSARLNGSAFGDAFRNSAQNIGNLNAGQTSTVYFEGTVASNLPACQQTVITNSASTSADRMSTISDTANVTVNNTSGCSIATYPQMSISKMVRNNTQNTTFQKSVNASVNNRVTFQITVSNTGTQTLNNVYVNDLLPSGLSFISGTVRLDGSNASDSLIGNRLYIGQLSTSQQRTILFDANVSATSATTLTNVAQAAADNYGQIQDTANVLISQVNGGFVNLSYSKRAFNETKNIDATSAPADRENFILYTVTVRNDGNAPATNFVVSDDLSGVLNYASMVDLNGGTMNGNVISWPAEIVPTGSSISHTFRVRVKYTLPQGSLNLVNTYGNTVIVKLVQPKVLGAVFVAPKTGSSATTAFVFAGLVTLAIAFAKRKGLFPKVRFE